MERLKLEDLMVNDIVLAEAVFYDEDTGKKRKEWHPLRITNTLKRMFLVNFVDSIGDWLDDCDAEEIGDIKPIPLTEEILKANGFDTLEEISVYHEDGTIGDGMWQNEELCCGYDNTEGLFELYTFSYDQEEDGTNQTKQKIIYVHQLQDALRLCGLEDMADNFKLE